MHRSIPNFIFLIPICKLAQCETVLAIWFAIVDQDKKVFGVKFHSNHCLSESAKKKYKILHNCQLSFLKHVAFQKYGHT